MHPQLQSLLHQAYRAYQAGDLTGAEKTLKNFISIIPDDFDAVHLLAIIYASQGNHLAAIEWYLRALALNPNDASAISNFGSSLNAIGQNEDALLRFRKAQEISPNAPEYPYNAGNVLCDLQRYQDAIFCYQRSVQLNPKYYQAHNNYGKALFDLNRYPEALVCFNRALEINQDFLDALVNKGEALKELKQYDEAIACFDKAIGLKPNYAEAYSNKGNVLNMLKRYDEAIACFDKAIGLKPNYAEAYSNKGNVLNMLKRYDEAVDCYEKALSLKPDIDWVSGNLLHVKMKICSWSEFEGNLKTIINKLAANERVANPFPLLALIDDPSLQKQSSVAYVQDKFPFNPVLGPILKYSQNQKIRLGYFSADFHNHATGYLMAELFELHDKTKFELFGFSFGPIANDEMRRRLEKSFDQFIEVGNKSDIEIAQLSRSLNIDIAIDLKGFTQDARVGIFSYRAAPIQVNYLGYPGTMGADYIDYIIADKTIIPVESQSYYSEKVIYLPNSYQVNDRKRLISERQFTKQELGLPENGFVFCCFNNNFKILPATFAGWMRILRATEGSVLWLFQDNSWVAENLKKEAIKHGVDANRLIFAERMPLPEHLARHRQADLFLDTFPCNAHTTASDALWAGLPVLTLMGESFASRVAASLLNAIGLPDLITHSQQDYETLAIELAMSPEKLEVMKQKLPHNTLSHPLFDAPLFTRQIEAAYMKIIESCWTDLEFENTKI